MLFEDYTNVLLVQQLHHELKKTDSRKARIFKLVYEGLTYREIARRLGLSETTVKTSWGEAKYQLLQYLNGRAIPFSKAFASDRRSS